MLLRGCHQQPLLESRELINRRELGLGARGDRTNKHKHQRSLRLQPGGQSKDLGRHQGE
jgi:hypothetical protein